MEKFISECEHCGRPSAGPNRCPHAIDAKLLCPLRGRETGERLRHIGVM